jgi:hypothetical protein
MLSAKRIIPEEMRSVFSMVPSASSCEPQATNAELEARSSKLISKKAGRARSLGLRLDRV